MATSCQDFFFGNFRGRRHRTTAAHYKAPSSSASRGLALLLLFRFNNTVHFWASRF
jgi:hypothetical protein